MDDGKPTGPQAKWWSRPTARRADHPEPTGGPEPEGPARASAVPDQAPPAPVPAAQDQAPDQASATQAPAVQDAAPAARGQVSAPASPSAAVAPADEPGGQEIPRPRPSGQPLHEPDEYSTPPYGGPGPWAPAPPVQRPTPAHGTVVPPGAGGPSPQYPA
ncbi:protease, partial [Streptomyces sp. MBT55]|nr:protease [Streptomyces sp. MBT55]